MPTRGELIREINGEIQTAVDSFNEAIPGLENGLVRRINLIIKELDLTADGTIKQTVANLNKMNRIEREMSAAFESQPYLRNVEKFQKSYNKVEKLEGKYFNQVLTEYSQPAIMDEIKAQSVAEVGKALTASNITANVIEPVNQLVRQSIESGDDWDALRSSINTFLKGAEGSPGALSRYTTTITNDALNTYSRTYENIIADRNGLEWFEYVGREMTTTREFCRTLDAKRWFHKSEIPGFMKGQVGDRSVPLYKKTGKPYGMKAETNANNFVQLAGGWNCGHHAYPVPTELVPKRIIEAHKAIKG